MDKEHKRYSAIERARKRARTDYKGQFDWVEYDLIMKINFDICKYAIYINALVFQRCRVDFEVLVP